MIADTQHLALISHLQAVDFMAAVVLIRDPQVFVLEPGWGRDDDSMVYDNSRTLLPGPLARLYSEYVEGMRRDVGPVIWNNGQTE